ncbi:MAG: glycosyltransferase family 2 protein [Bryobacteraceae bacterium]
MEGLLAVFVTYNSAGYIGRAVESCLQQNIFIVVVDNGSTDGTLAAIPSHANVRVVANGRNLGFAGGVNCAVRESNASYFLLLNPDIELLDPIGPLVTAVVEKGHNAAAGLLVDTAGNPQKGFSFRRLPTPAALAFEVLGINRIWPVNPVNRWYRCLDLDPLQPQAVEQPAGACFLFRRDDWERLGGFDEGFYPVWYEDVDFCRRLLATGGRIWFNPLVRVLHHGGHSVQKIELGYRERVWYGSLLRYVAKHFRPLSRRIVAIIVALAVIPRILTGRGEGPIHSRVHSIKFIWRLAWRCFQTGSPAEYRPGRERDKPSKS